MKRIAIVVGTRPNFIKITQFPTVFKKYINKFEFQIIHTGQHYDDKMSDVFFRQFNMLPDIYLHTTGSSPNSQIADTMVKLEKSFEDFKPDLVMVVGDVNSTLSAALTASKMNIKIAHIESGLRSFDRTMPEELNRVITDSITDFFFVTEQSGIDNLLKEGKAQDKIFFVGNTMIDTLVAFKNQIEASGIFEKLSIKEKEFVLMTIHRPATVDSKVGLTKLIELIIKVTKKYKVVFPIHPRTLAKMQEFDLKDKITGNENLIISEPLDYFSFQKLIKGSKFILTDSGGIQEESTYLQVPCLTLRPNTERPSTIEIGTNELTPFDISAIESKIKDIESGIYKKGSIPPFWDGNATERIVKALIEII